MFEEELPSTRPYLIRALHEWCVDNGFTPHVAVRVDHSVQVPREYVKDGEIVLNISYDATSSLRVGNDLIEFKARFGGKPHHIMVPLGRVLAIFARENGQGMAFPVLEDDGDKDDDSGDRSERSGREKPSSSTTRQDARPALEIDEPPPPPAPPAPGQRPALKRVK